MKKKLSVKIKKHSEQTKTLSELLQIQDFSLICVTGKMASGKNFVTSKLEQDGWQSVDADKLVHIAINDSTEEIVKTFLPYAKKENLQIVTSENKIDRRELGKLLFSNPALLKIQEEIIYPKVIKMTEDFILQNKKAIINATVLYKIPHLLQRCQTIVYVKAPFIKRIKRSKKRDKLSIIQIIQRFYSQKKLFNEYKKSKVPIVIVKN